MAGQHDLILSELNEEDDPAREENLKTIDRSVQIIMRTAERYFRENNAEKGREVVESLEKFKIGCLSFMALHNVLLEKDRVVGGFTETIERYVPAYLMRVDAGEIPFCIPKERRVPQPSVQHPNADPPPTTSNANDSFNHTVVVIPRKHSDISANSRKVTSYDSIQRITFIHLDVLHTYRFKYVNVVGQVISSFKTNKGNICIRFWDGSPHRTLMGSFHLFHAENSMIETFYAAPRASLAGVPRSYYADIDVYGEYVTTAQSLKSGDIIAIVNLHVYRNPAGRLYQPTIHEGGEKYSREVFILNEEEREGVERKQKLYDIAEELSKLKGDKEGDSRMKTFFHNAEKNLPAVDIRFVDGVSTSTDTNEPTSFRTANEIFINQVKNQTSALKASITKKRCVISSDESGDDEIILIKNSRDTRNKKEQKKTPEIPKAVLTYTPPERARSPIISHRTEPVEPVENVVIQKVAVLQKRVADPDPFNVDLVQFFRQRLKPPVKQQIKAPVLTVNFKRPAKVNVSDVSIQVTPKKPSAKVSEISIQVTPEKHSIGVQTDERKESKSISIGIQTSPVKNSAPRKRKHNLISSAQTTARSREMSESSEEPRAKQSLSRGVVTRSRAKVIKPVKLETISSRSTRSSNVQIRNLTGTARQDVVIRVTPQRSQRNRQSLDITPPRPPMRRSSLIRDRTQCALGNLKQQNDVAPRPPPHGRKPQNLQKTPEKGHKVTAKIGKKDLSKDTDAVSETGSIREEEPRIITRSANRDLPNDTNTVVRSETGSEIEKKPRVITRSRNRDSSKEVRQFLIPQIMDEKPRVITRSANKDSSNEIKGFLIPKIGSIRREEKPIINKVLASPPLKAKVALNNRRTRDEQ